MGTTLPSHQTLRGEWSVDDDPAGGARTDAISFGFSLAAPPAFSVVGPGGGGVCPGTSGNPQADPGVVCLYQDFGVPPTVQNHNGSPGTDPFGLILVVNTTFGARGSWAVTAP